MVRPRDGDGIKRTIVKRGDRFYAYEITSVMENGKKRTVSTYLHAQNFGFILPPPNSHNL